MGKLKPIGSEKLQGMDKINRILEIAKYKENIPTPINEDKSIDYSKTLSDGNKYHIVKEKNGYVIKKSLTESTELDYIEPMRNRKYYSSYSQAFKRLNLIAKEVNINEGYNNNVNLFEGEVDEKASTKYILKFGETKEQSSTPAPAPAPVPAPAPAPSPEPSPEVSDTPMDEPDMLPPSDDMGVEDDDDDDVVTFKTIQKLTGRLAQKIRVLNDNEEQQMTSKDIKYVINSILSAIVLDNLEEDDVEDIINKLEGVEDDNEGTNMGGDMESDMGGDMEGDMEGDLSTDAPLEPSPEGEMSEKMSPKEFVDNLFDDLEESNEIETNEDKHFKKIGDMIEGVFTESKVDNILKKYFSTTDSEKKQTKVKQSQILENKKKVTQRVSLISETVSQEIMSKKLISTYPQANLLGKTKNKNLVFEIKNKQIKVTPNGKIL
jgi:hypothetical protein